MTLRPALLVCLVSCVVCSGGPRAAVLISEIHYNPAEGPVLELVELRNSSGTAVPLAGWRFRRGIDFTFPQDAVIAPSGFVVVARDPDRLAERYQLTRAELLGPFAGTLDNGGETLSLADAQDAIADEVRYDDDAPWDAAADGSGRSLERLCLDADSWRAENWRASPGEPTPLAPAVGASCPPELLPPPAVSFNEIHYHPLHDADVREELIELRNNGTTPVNLRGYELSTGVKFQFEQDLILAPQGLVVVARNKDHLQTKLGIQNVVGNFEGQLSNDGERLTLLDAAGNLVDSVAYGDADGWPVPSDGLGKSLEKKIPTAPSDDPASWSASSRGASFAPQRVKVSGIAPGARLVIAIDGTGSCLVDNVSLVDPANPGKNFVFNGTFDRGIDNWFPDGNHWATGWDPGAGTGTGAMRIAAKTTSFAGFSNSVFTQVDGEIRINGPSYDLSFDFLPLSGLLGVTVKIEGSTAARGIYWRFESTVGMTPGAESSVAAERLAPAIDGLGRFPREPGSTDAVTITARVRADAAIAAVRLRYEVDGKPAAQPIPMLDDGQHGDRDAGDGIFGGHVPAQTHNSIVTFRIEAEDAGGGNGVTPLEGDPSRVHGYYVNDQRPASKLSIYHMLLLHRSALQPRSITDSMLCQYYWTGAFAYRGDLYPNVGLRRRGKAVCGSPKPYMKVKFQRGRELDGQRKINLQGIWTDKSLIREKLSWELFRDFGLPYAKDEDIRLHINGRYFGLYGIIEHPDEKFLRRNGLPPEGHLYKAESSNEDYSPDYRQMFEKKTGDPEDFTDITDFLHTMHATSGPRLFEFFGARASEDRLLEYHLGEVLINNIDHTSHNHYLYHDTTTGRWFPIAWDLDISFGKAGVFDDNEYNPGTSPWFGTQLEGEFSSYLLDKFFFQAGDYYRRAYLARLWLALREKYTQEHYAGRIDFYRALLDDEQRQDIAVWGRLDGGFPKDFESNLARVAEHVRLRRAYLVGYLDSRARFREPERLKITEIAYNPGGPEESLELVELWNPGTKEIQLQGWSIEGIGFTFPAGAKARAQEVIVIAKDPAAFAARYGNGFKVFGPYDGNLANDGEAIRVRDAGPGYPATIDFVRYGGEGWPLEADGFGHTLELKDVTADLDNDPADRWRASAAPGGTPGIVPGVTDREVLFSRGDVNANGRANVTDALVLLGYLFQGAGEPACVEAADINGDQHISIGDAIVLLNYLFRGAAGAIPPPAPGTCATVPVLRCLKEACVE